MGYNHQTEQSQRKSSKTFTHESKTKIMPMTINRTLRKLEIKYCTRAPHPDTPDHQLQRIKNGISERTQKTLIMDVESYITFSGCKMPSNAGRRRKERES